MTKTNPTRRKFLQQASVLGAAACLPVHTLLAAQNDETINLGIVGCGWRGGQLFDLFSKVPGVHIAGLCDVDQELVDQLGEKAPSAKKWTDMRELFDSPEIDAVVIATCNHWHCLAAIWAMEAGKHVYVEKPLGHTQWEGEQVVHAAVKYQRICQVGTQQRSDPMQAEIKQFLHDEKAIGKLESVRVNRFGERESIGRRKTPLVPPKSVDYDLWLGPAQDLPLYREKLHYDWHWNWNTGSGEMGNWGVHILDDVRNNLFRDSVAAPSAVTAAGGRFAWDDAGETPNAHFAVLEAGEIPVVVTLSNLPIKNESIKVPGPSSGYIGYYSGGRLEGQRGKAKAFDAAGKLMKEFEGDGGNPHHQQNFIDAIREDKASLLAAPVHIGNDSTAWCNFINIATRMPEAATAASISSLAPSFGSDALAAIFVQLNAMVASAKVAAAVPSAAAGQLQLGPTLRFDSEQGQFIGEQAASANRLFRREYRKPFVVPEIVSQSKQVPVTQ